MKVDPFADPAARCVRRRGEKKKAIYLSLPKSRGILVLESELESSCAQVLNVDPRVASIRSQPFTFDLNTGQAYGSKQELQDKCRGSDYTPRIYTPDLEVELVAGGYVLVEAKHSRFLEESPEYFGFPDILAQFGRRLILVSEEVHYGPIGKNARRLRSHVGGRSRPELWSALSNEAISKRDVGRLTGASDDDILCGITSGDLACDLVASRIGPGSRIRKSLGGTKHLEVLPL